MKQKDKNIASVAGLLHDIGKLFLLTVVESIRDKYKMGIDFREPGEQILVASPEAATLGLSEVDLAELEIMLEDAPLLSA